MTEQLDEALSAAIDGEADEFELRRVLDETAKHERLQETWHRYHRVSDYLSAGDPEAVRPRNFADMQQAVWEAIGGEMADDEAQLADGSSAVNGAAQPSGGARWSGRLLGVGVAATVAFAVMLVSGVFTGDQSVNAPSVADVEAPISLETEISPADLKRTTDYIRHHVRHTAVNASNGLTSSKAIIDLDHTVEAEQQNAAQEEDDLQAEAVTSE